MLRPFFSYYGSKWSLAPRYPTPEHDHVIEPFAGSAGYSTRHAARAVTLVDTYEPVIGTWRYLIATSAEEIERLPLIEPGQDVNDLPVCQEARWLIGWWVNKGSSTPHRTLSAWAREDRYAYQFWGTKIRSRIACQVDHIRHWRVIHGSYIDLDDHEATWFVDPPYSNAAGRKYPENKIDYVDLGAWCKDRRGQVIACENAGADWLPFEPFASAKATNGRQKGNGDQRSEEVIWTNNDTATTDWGTMADNDVMKEIEARVQARAQRVLDAHDYETNESSTANRIATALDELALCWREEADVWRDSKKRGWQSTATNLRTAATYVAAVALDVRKLAAIEDSERKPELASGDVVVVNGETSAGVVQPDGSYQIERRLEATVAYLAGRIDVPPGTEIVADTRPLPDDVIRSGSTLADQVKADQMTNSTPIPGARILQDPITSTYVPVSLGPRWTFEDLMSGPPSPATNADGTLLRHWSWSQLETIEDCGLKYRLRKVEHLPEVPQWALVGGRTFHACAEQIERQPTHSPDNVNLDEMWRNAFAKEIADVAASTTVPPDRWRASNKGAEGWTWWNESGPDMLKRYVDWRSMQNGSVLTIAGKPVIEYECELTLPGGNVVKVVVDFAAVREDGSIEIIDFKTGRMAADMSQLGLYAHALATLLNSSLSYGVGQPAPRIFGTIYDARKGEAGASVDLLTAHPLTEYIYRVHTAEATRQAGLYRPRKSSFCGGCSVQYACPLFAGKDS